MAIAYDSVSPDTSTAAGASTLTSGAFTIAGADRLLLGFMAAAAASGRATHSEMRRGNSGGTLLTQIGSTLDVGAGGRLSAWRLIAPAAASDTIYGLLSDSDDEVAIGGVSYTGVDQTTPVGTSVTNTGTIVGSSSGNMTVTVATAVGDVVVAAFWLVATSAANPDLTPNGTPTPTGRYDIETTQLGFEALQVQEVVATGTSTTVSCGYSSGGSFSGDWGAIAFVVNSSSSATVDQEGAQFGNDDGSESAHTFIGSQDANLAKPLGTALLIRALINGTGDPASVAYTLRYQKNGSGGYVAVPVGATVPEVFGTASYAGKGTGANGSTTVAPAHGSPTAGWYMLAVITSGATNSETPTAPDGTWTQLATGASTDGTFGLDTGPRRVTVFGKEATGSEGTGTATFSITNGNTCRGDFYYFSKAGSGVWQVTGQGGNDSTSGTGFSVTPGSINWNTGDATLVAVGQRVDSATQSAQSLTATGVTFGARTNRSSTAVTTGNDHRHVVDTFAAVTGTSNVNAAPTWAYTASASVSGGCVIVRLREYTAAVNNEIYVATSSNIAAGGEATTARLAAPSGKTTADFVTGRRWDDENGTDTIDITADDYTEVEWSINTQSPAVNGDYFDLRVYAGAAALGAYTVTPRLTLGTPPSPPFAQSLFARIPALRRM